LDNLTDQHRGKVSARRKLIRGVFATPALLAVQSGGANSASSINACLRQQNLHPRTEPVAASADTYFRYQLLAFVRVANPSSTWPLGSIRTADGYWISGAELTPFVRAGQIPFLGPGSWQKFDPTPGVNALVAGSVRASTPTTSAGTPSNWSLQKVASFVALRVNTSGAIVGAGASGTGSAVGTSCWSSFAMGAVA
jgi:hypothetical protein